MLEWLDSLSLGWYIASAVFALVIIWFAYEIYYTSFIKDDENKPRHSK